MVANKTFGRVASLLTVLALLGLLAGMIPAGRAAAQGDTRNFPETGKTVKGKFLAYWNNNGGLAQQGYPISDEMQEKSAIDGKTYTVQYFERSVFELHPENQAPYDVLLTLLGTLEYQQRYPNGAPGQTASTTNVTKFNETGQTLGGKFRTYWEQHGGLAQQGYPISNEFKEVSALDGKTYTVQYFQRAVFELHPENQAPYDVLLSQLGKFAYTTKYGTVTVKPTGAGALNGAGGTFPVPLYTKWFQDYSTNINKNVTFNYQPVGSGAGITAITNKTVDFAASDAPLNDTQLAAAPGLIQIPTVAGAVVLAFNVEGISGLVLDGKTVADIFLGKITTWNDPAIAALNPGVSLPGSDIAVVHRSDGSGTSYIFTSYLSAVSDEWKSTVGAGTTPNWPVGLGGRGNAGVAGLVQQTPDSIGYVELAYAVQNKMSFAKMKNKAGNVVEANISSTNAAFNGVTIPANFQIPITDPSDPGAWPIAGFTYIMVYKDLNNISDAGKAAGLVEFLWWAAHEGQNTAKDLLYSRAPLQVTKKVEQQILSITFNGQPVIKQ